MTEMKVTVIDGPEANGTDSPAGAPAAPVAVSKVEKHGWTITDRPGHFRMIPKSGLKIDHDYQRDAVSESRILKIAREWSWVACGALHVAERSPGDYWIMDGQHRKLAADRRDDITLLPCLVFAPPGIAKEAKGFRDVNNNRGSVAAYDKFKAACREGDQSALAVRDLVREFGYEVSRQRQDQGAACVAALLSAYRQDPNVARVVLGVAVELAGGRPLHERIFSGLFHLETRLRRVARGRPGGISISDANNRETLCALGEGALLRRISDANHYHARGGPRVWADGIVNAINTRRRSRRLPSMFGTDSPPAGPEADERGVGGEGE